MKYILIKECLECVYLREILPQPHNDWDESEFVCTNHITKKTILNRASTISALIKNCPLPDLPDVTKMFEALKKISDLQTYEYEPIDALNKAWTIAHAAIAKAEGKQ